MLLLQTKLQQPGKKYTLANCHIFTVGLKTIVQNTTPSSRWGCGKSGKKRTVEKGNEFYRAGETQATKDRVWVY